jgi:outer membrane receptor protein involved in Fe transport
MNVLFPSEEVGAQVTHAVSGSLDPRKALKIMVEGTGLKYHFVGESVVVTSGVTPEAVASSSDSLGPTESYLSTVEISGKWFHGEIERPMGVSPLRIDEVDIRDSGASTVVELLRTLPQVFGGGPTENTHDFGREAQTNSAIGTGVNLRGLGAGATLILLNGTPLAPGGTVGGFVDISNLPLSAIDHVDIMATGGSILYGAGAIGGIVNFILRERYNGLELESRVGGRAGDSVGGWKQLHLTGGKSWSDGSVTVSAEYYDRDALWASQRSRATSDLVPFGGTDFDTLAGNPGTVLYGGQTYAIPRNPSGRTLTASDFVAGTYNESDLFQDTSILPDERLLSLMVTGSQRIGDHVTLFMHALGSQRNVRSQAAGDTAALEITPTNPFYVNPIGVQYTDPEEVLFGFGNYLGPLELRSVVDGGQVTVGADYVSDTNWHARIYGGYSLSKQKQRQDNRVNYTLLSEELINPDKTQAFNPYADGAQSDPRLANALRDTGLFHVRSAVSFGEATLSGPLLRIPSGYVGLTVGVSRQQQTFYASAMAVAEMFSQTDDLNRRTDAVFAELTVPLIGKEQRVAWLKRLEISGGLRHEHYSNLGSSNSPQLGFEADVPGGVTLEGTWAARSFEAPNLGDLSVSSNASAILPLADPQSTARSGPSNVLVLEGNNPSLKPQTARSWTLGLNVSLFEDRPARLALTYFNTKFSDLVGVSPALSPNALSDPIYSSLYVQRNVTPAQRAAYCSEGQFVGLPQDCTGVPIAAVVDLRLHNRAVIDTSGFDLNARYAFDLPIGKFSVRLLGTYLLDYSEAATALDVPTSVLNTAHNPINLRLRGSLTWNWRGLRAAAFVNHQNSYRNVESALQHNVDSWTTVDATVGYEFGKFGWGGVKSLDVELSALNVFNHNPPFLDNLYEKIGYDEENGDLVGRNLSLDIRARW